MPRSTSRLASQYAITHSLFRHDYDIISANGKHSYHVDNSHLTPGKPDLTFHEGDAKGPIAGVCKYRHFSSDAIIGLGDPTHPHRMSWEHFTREGLLSCRYSFRVKLGGGRARTFTWRYNNQMSCSSGDLSSRSSSTSPSQSPSRSSSRSSSRSRSSSSSTNPTEKLELVHESTQEVIAELSSGTSFFRKAGQLNIYKSYGTQFDLLVLVTGLALQEKLRRTRSNSGTAQ
ncbi:hypothetical protein N7540_010421 [Penicillium herquei]|nr:hypothetical protein N7540_010421 [Penicillium herquei]